MTAMALDRPLAGGFTRRGACPALSAPMKTGDGLLVRLNPVAGGLSPQALIGLCQAADEHGNGVVEVTARGSVQVRGLTTDSAVEFAAVVNKLGIPVHTGVPVQTSVLAGLDPGEISDPTPLAEAIRAGIAAEDLESRLGPKVSVVVDGGGKTALDEVAADVRLRADNTGWLVAIAGDAETARPLTVASSNVVACEITVSLLSRIANAGRAARARDLDEPVLQMFLRLGHERSTLSPSGLPTISPTRGESSRSTAALPAATVEAGEDVDDSVISPLRGEITGRPEGGVKEEKSLIGSSDLRDCHVALGVALPFGHTTAGRLKTLAEKARSLGIDDIRPAPKRTLVAICGTDTAARELRSTAETLGFITAPNDPRQSISACPGAPDCASGHMPARKVAALIANEHGDLFDGSVHLHVSGCAKGCAHPAASALTLVGAAGGIGLVANGTARDEATAFADRDAAGRAFANVAQMVSAERRQGETTAHAIHRIGFSKLAEALGKGGT